MPLESCEVVISQVTAHVEGSKNVKSRREVNGRAIIQYSRQHVSGGKRLPLNIPASSAYIAYTTHQTAIHILQTYTLRS